MITLHYQLLFPTPNARGSTMLDYIMDEQPRERTYAVVYDGTIDCEPQEQSALEVCERLWTRHNIGDVGHENRPRATEIRSMCIGDLLRFKAATLFGDDAVWIADQIGFTFLTPDARPTLVPQVA